MSVDHCCQKSVLIPFLATFFFAVGTVAGADELLEPNATSGARQDEVTLLADVQERDEPWSFTLYPEIWATGLDGTVGKGRLEADVDAGFDDLIDKTDFGFVLAFDISKGPWTFMFYGQYFAFEDDGHLRGGADLDLELDQLLIDPAIGYRFADIPLGDSKAQHLTLEAIVGVRWTYLETTVEVTEGPLAGRMQDREPDWFDPYVGGRGRIYFNEKFAFSAKGTVGGFGVGSDFAWSAEGLFEWQISRSIGLRGGYRALDYDYDDDIIFDVTLHGPVIGMSFTW